jgi:hypothetical protein
VDGVLNNAGNLDVNGGTLVIQGTATGGTATIEAGSVLEFGGASHLDATFANGSFTTFLDSFTYNNGTFSYFFDGAVGGSYEATYAHGINDAGQIVGYAVRGDGSGDTLPTGVDTLILEGTATRASATATQRATGSMSQIQGRWQRSPATARTTPSWSTQFERCGNAAGRQP